MNDPDNVLTSTAAGRAKLAELDAATLGPRTILRPSYAVDRYQDDNEIFISVEVTFSPERREAACAAMLALVERAFAEVE